MSDWGLVQLGKLNPALEKVEVTTESSVISPSATELLRSILPRTQDRTFKVNLPDEYEIALTRILTNTDTDNKTST